jgi:hypothetical protein
MSKSKILYLRVYLYHKIYICHFKVALIQTTLDKIKNFADFIANNYPKIYHVKKKMTYS